MKFREAVKIAHARDGWDIRRADWPDNMLVHVTGADNFSMVFVCGDESENYAPTTKDVLAKDWEVLKCVPVGSIKAGAK